MIFDYFDNKENINKINLSEKIGERIKENYYKDLINNYQNENNCDEYAADDEDNSKGEIYSNDEFPSDEDSGDDNPDKIIIPNDNNSFAEYGQFIDLTKSDKKNPQFDEIINNNNFE